MPSSPYPREAAMSKIIPSPMPNIAASSSSSNLTHQPGTASQSSSNNNPNSHSHQVGARQATRSRTRTRQAQTNNGNGGAGPSRPSAASLPRYNSEDHPLSPHKLAAKGYHTFQCLGIPFHVKRRYTFLRELGIGAYGCVALARDHLLDCNVAIKKVTRVFERDVLARRALREVAVLRHIGLCDNVTALLDFDTTFIEFHEIYLVLEASEADLSQIIRSGQMLSDAHLQYFVAQILRGVRYMHAANIIHRDLKPGNLLVNADCQLKLCDFGLARAYAERSEPQNEATAIETFDDPTASPKLERSFPESPKDAVNPTSPKANLMSEDEQQKQSQKMRLHTTELDFPGGPLTEYVATRWYRAPEIMLCFRRGYGQQIDMWAVGCILAELLGGKPIFAGQDYVDQIARINNVLGSPGAKTISKIGSERAKKYVESLPKMPAVPFARLYPNASPQAVDLLSKLLCWDPSDRISAEEALMHPWLKAYHRSNRNWTMPNPFNRFEEVELLQTISDFRMGLEREADELRAELAAIEADVDGIMLASGEKEDDKGGDSPPQSADEGDDEGGPEGSTYGSEAVNKDDKSSYTSPQSNRGSAVTRMTRSTSSIGDSPVPTPSTLATSAHETSPTYETDLTSASAPHSVTGNHSGKRNSGQIMDGLGLLHQSLQRQEDQQSRAGNQDVISRIEESVDSSRCQERRALDETLANHGLLCGDVKSQIDSFYDSKTSYRRRAVTNAPSQRITMRRAGSSIDLRCAQSSSMTQDQTTSITSPKRSIDITRRSTLQRERHDQVMDDTESISTWLRPASAEWNVVKGIGKISHSREGSDTVTEPWQGPGTADTLRQSPGAQ